MRREKIPIVPGRRTPRRPSNIRRPRRQPLVKEIDPDASEFDCRSAEVFWQKLADTRRRGVVDLKAYEHLLPGIELDPIPQKRRLGETCRERVANLREEVEEYESWFNLAYSTFLENGVDVPLDAGLPDF